MSDIGFNLLMPDRERGHATIGKSTVRGMPMYSGKASVNFSTWGDDENYDLLKSRPWLIAHPDCEGKQFRAVSIEKFCLHTTCYTLPIGIVVEEIK